MRTTSQKVSSAAAKIMLSRTASKAEKAVAAAALTQTNTRKERLASLNHEALDRANTIAIMIEELLVGHPGLSTPELRLKLKAVEDAAAELYQAIGRVSE